MGFWAAVTLNLLVLPNFLNFKNGIWILNLKNKFSDYSITDQN